MKQVINIIKQKIAECEMKGDMFDMPTLNRDDVTVTKNELGLKGASLYRYEYRMDFTGGGWIHIEYASRSRVGHPAVKAVAASRLCHPLRGHARLGSINGGLE